MTVAVVLTVLVALAVGGLVGYRAWIRKRSFDEASRIAKTLFPTWAQLGPFDRGANSATALYMAYLFRLGHEDLERALFKIVEHEKSYDDDPSGWENTRSEALQSSTSSTQRDAIQLRAYIHEHQSKAVSIVSAQERDLEALAHRNDDLRSYLSNASRDNTLLSLEMQYVWGVFSQLSSDSATDNPVHQIATAHLLNWLVSRHAMSFQSALAEARSVLELHESDDRLFRALSDRGKRAVQGINEADYVIALQAVDERFRTALDKKVLNEDQSDRM